MCFGLDWLEAVFIWIVVVALIIALLRLLAAFVVPKLGFPAEIISFISTAIWYVIVAIVCIFAIVFIFDLISCFAGGLHLPRMH